MDSGVESVKLYTNGALVTRKARVEGPAALAQVVLKGVEAGVEEKSIRVYLSAGYVRSVTYSTYKEEPGDGKGELEEELRRVRRKIEVLTSKISGLKAYISSIDSGFTTALTAFMATVSTGKADADYPLEASRKLLGEREEALKELVEAEDELEKAKRRAEELESLLKKGRGLVEKGRVAVEVEEVPEGGADMLVSYVVDRAGWKPFYDVYVDGGVVELDFYARIVQETGASWRGVKPFITSRRIGHAEIEEPEPWFIGLESPGYTYAATGEGELAAAPPPPMKKAKPRALKAARPSMVAAEKVSGEYVSYVSRRPVDVEPGKPALALLSTAKFEGETKAYWDAFMGEEPVELVEFKNTSREMFPPGPARVYKGRLFVGETGLEGFSPGETVKIVLADADLLEVERKLVLVKASKSLVGGKASLRRGYRLKVKSHYKGEVEVQVLDRYPVSEDPEVKVSLKEARPQPEVEGGAGILRWQFRLGPEEERELYFEFEVTYPSDGELEGI